MDPVTALGVAAAVVQFVDLGTKVTKRLVEYIKASPGDIPKQLVDIAVQLPLISKSVSSIKDENHMSKYDHDTRFILHGVVLGCLKLAQELDDIATKLSPQPGESLNAKLKKVLGSLKSEHRIAEIDRGLQAYIQVLILHQVVNPNDAGVGLPADATFYEVKEIRTESPIRRPRYITRLHEAFRQVSRKQQTKPEFVALTGNEGVGKTQLALEYCQEVREAGHFRAIFWFDASSPASLKHGLESACTTVRRTRAGSATEKLEFFKTFLSELWHSWLLVLDNYQPESFDFSSLTQFLPSEGHGGVLLLARTPQVSYAAVQIRVHKALTKEDYTAWRREVSDGIVEKQMNVLIDAISEGLDVNSRGADVWQDEGSTIVELAAESGFTDAVELLLDRGADPHLVKHHGSVLSAAVRSGHIPTLEVYLAYEDRTGYRMEDDDYGFAVTEALHGNQPGTLQVLLLRRGHNINQDKGIDFQSAALAGHLDCVRLIVESDKLPSSATKRASILSNAVLSGKVELVKFLINDNRFDPNEQDHNEEQALISAMKLDDRSGDQSVRHEITSLLLDAGASPNSKNGYSGLTPLHVAAHSGFTSITKLLLDRGADPSIELRTGLNVLEYCHKQRHVRINQMLASVKLADTEMHKKYYGRLIFLASRQGDRTLALQVLEEAEIDAVDKATGETPLMAAIARTQLPIARMLVRKGARQDVRDRKDRSPLRLAAELDMHLLIQDMAKSMGPPGTEDVDKEGYTPLMLAAKARKHQTVSTLLALGADQDAMNDFGETALDIAEESQDEKLIAILKGEP